jgi:hypothetical protein
MKLDRNLSTSGKGKYALINLRKIHSDPRTPQDLAFAILQHPECVEFGEVGTENEFFPIKLKDINAESALIAYAMSAGEHDSEYATEIADLASRSGRHHPNCKIPD